MQNQLEAKINSVIDEIELGLLRGHINTNTPHQALNEQTKLGAYLSMCYGMIERLDTLEAQHYVNTRPDHKSDLSVKKKWSTGDEGVRQTFWENRIKRIKVLIETLEKVYYQGRDDYKQRTLK